MSTLFTAVSVEQQEIVAGGAAIALETLNQFVEQKIINFTNVANKTQASTSLGVSETTGTNSLFKLFATNAQ
jgi:hypothetical protein